MKEKRTEILWKLETEQLPIKNWRKVIQQVIKLKR